MSVRHVTRFTSYKNAGYTAYLHLAFENFAMSILLKDSAVLVKLFYKNNDCETVALQKFRKLMLKDMKKGVGPMTEQGF